MLSRFVSRIDKHLYRVPVTGSLDHHIMEGDRLHANLEPVPPPIDRLARDVRHEGLLAPRLLDPFHIEPAEYDLFNFEEVQ